MAELQRVSFKKPVTPQPRLSKRYMPGKRDERFWTDEEDKIIRARYPKGGWYACSLELGPQRSKSAIYGRAGHLGVHGSKKAGGGTKHKIEAPDGFDDKLREFYQNGDGKKRGECGTFADDNKLPRWWVTKRAIQLGLTMPHKKEPPWTDAENELMKSVPLHDPLSCAEIFREHGFTRSPTAITVRAKRLDLSRRYNETMSATRVAKILGIDGKTATREILQGDLEAQKRKTNRLAQQGGDPWSVTPEQLRRYILKHLERIDLRKVDKFAFVQIVAGEPLDAVTDPKKGRRT